VDGQKYRFATICSEFWRHPVGVIDRNRANSIDREHDETDYLQEKLGIAGTISERIFYIVKIALYLLFALEPQ